MSEYKKIASHKLAIKGYYEINWSANLLICRPKKKIILAAIGQAVIQEISHLVIMKPAIKLAIKVTIQVITSAIIKAKARWRLFSVFSSSLFILSSYCLLNVRFYFVPFLKKLVNVVTAKTVDFLLSILCFTKYILYFQPNKKEETVRRIYYPLILGLLFISSIYGQALEDGLWQLQNPNQMNISSLLSFDKVIITNGSMDMTTGQMGEAKGTYKCSGKNLLINIYNDQYSYTITWVNKDKLILNSVGNKLILAKSGTAEDTYFKRYIDWYGMFGYGSGGSYGGSGGGSSYSPPKQEICYTCRGVKRCKICEGAGQWKNSFAPFEWHKCSACEGTGKCWHCKGTGIQ